MDVRSGAYSQPSAPLPTSRTWRVSAGFAALKCCATVALVIAAVVLSGDRRMLTAALVGAVVLGGYALRDVVAPVRLAADPDGVTVISGFLGRQRLAWAQIERMRVDTRSRGGLRSELLEIDIGDNLFLLSRFDLNAHPADVADELLRIRGF